MKGKYKYYTAGVKYNTHYKRPELITLQVQRIQENNTDSFVTVTEKQLRKANVHTQAFEKSFKAALSQLRGRLLPSVVAP